MVLSVYLVVLQQSSEPVFILATILDSLKKKTIFLWLIQLKKAVKEISQNIETLSSSTTQRKNLSEQSFQC